MDYLRLTSKENNTIKLCRSLQQRKHREKQHLFLIEGLRNGWEALQSAWPLQYLLVDEKKAVQPELQRFLSAAEQRVKKIFLVSAPIFAGITDTQESQGILLLAQWRQQDTIAFFKQAAGKDVAILSGLQDPGNLGGILRTAWAAGLGGVILTDHTVDLYNPKVVRAAMGALYHLPVIALANEQVYSELKQRAYQILVADAGGKPVQHCLTEDTQAIAWVLGNEGNGPSDFWRQQRDETVSIPMAAEVESLNVGVAAGILFYAKLWQKKS